MKPKTQHSISQVIRYAVLLTPLVPVVLAALTLTGCNATSNSRPSNYNSLRAQSISDARYANLQAQLYERQQYLHQQQRYLQSQPPSQTHNTLPLYTYPVQPIGTAAPATSSPSMVNCYAEIAAPGQLSRSVCY